VKGERRVRARERETKEGNGGGEGRGMWRREGREEFTKGIMMMF
jgi:hypothetical protein